MPAIVKKLAVIAAAEGIVLRPLGQPHLRCMRIAYGTHEISSLESSSIPEFVTSVEACGTVGIQHPLSGRQSVTNLLA